MDHSSNTSPRSLPTPRSPAPLALSEFMAQATPCSDTTHPSEKPALSLDARKSEAVEELKQAPAQDKPQTPPPQQDPEEKQAPLSNEEEDAPPPADWLATRQQLLPRRNQGKKGDWIRGWSQAVISHGDAAYCACSETIENTQARGRKSRSSDLAGNVRAILQRAGSPSSNTKNSNKTTTAPSEPEVCRNCSRPPSPPSTATDNGSPTSETPLSERTRRLGKRFSVLFMRVRPSRSKSAAHKRDSEIRNMAWPEEYQPQWATTGQGEKRFLARPPSQPVSAPVAGTATKSREGGDYFGRLRDSHSRGRIRNNATGPSSSELEGITDSDAPRPVLSRSMSRLQRAAALLQRATSRPKD